MVHDKAEIECCGGVGETSVPFLPTQTDGVTGHADPQLAWVAVVGRVLVERALVVAFVCWNKESLVLIERLLCELHELCFPYGCVEVNAERQMSRWQSLIHTAERPRMCREVAQHTTSRPCASSVHLLKRPCTRSVFADRLPALADVSGLACPLCGFCCQVVLVAPGILELAQAEKPWAFTHNSSPTCCC